MFDVAIVYRVYPGISKIPPIHRDNKYKLAELSLASFAKFIGNLNVKLWVILDGCPDKYEDLFNRYFNGSIEFIKTDGIGNSQTFGKQMDILSEQSDSEYIYFAEDDYYYLPNKFEEMLDFIKSGDDKNFISPYDHPDYYNLHLHEIDYDEVKSGNTIWRNRASTTMTFLTTKSSLKKSESLFRTYTKNNWDSSLWLSLTKRQVNSPSFIFSSVFGNPYYSKIIAKAWYHCAKHLFIGDAMKLWVPTPSFATHLDSEHLAPGYDWYNIFQHEG